jgi:HEAT repeat protein
VALVLASLLGGPAAGAEPSRAVVERLLAAGPDYEGLRALGPEVMPVLARIYADSGPAERQKVANAFYSLGWRSEAAREVLAGDLGTDRESLRLSVQWAIGRVSGDEEVVQQLLAILRSDPNALFSEKAACALAHDQIHLTDRQKLALYGGLIETLSSPVGHVRRDAIRALEIHTGQRRGFQPWGDSEARERAVRDWQRWLREYASHL